MLSFFFRTAWRSPELLAGLWSRCKYCSWRLLILLSLNLVFCRGREKYYHLFQNVECRYQGCINTSRLFFIRILKMYSLTSHFFFLSPRPQAWDFSFRKKVWVVPLRGPFPWSLQHSYPDVSFTWIPCNLACDSLNALKYFG